MILLLIWGLHGVKDESVLLKLGASLAGVVASESHRFTGNIDYDFPASRLRLKGSQEHVTIEVKGAKNLPHEMKERLEKKFREKIKLFVPHVNVTNVLFD
jgi:hypothetical protein